MKKIYNSHKYHSIFSQMLNNLTISSIIQMVNEYLQQYRMTFAEFYAQFCIEQEKIDIKLNNIQRFICDYNKQFEPDTECKEEFSTYEELENHINKIHYDKLGEQLYDQSYFINRPWINDIIKKTFICNVDNESSVLDFDLFIKTIDSNPNKFTDVNGNVWFQANKHFFNIETNKFVSKTQNDEILTFYDNRYKTCLLKIKLGFKIVSDDPTKDFIIQNEDIFRNEQDFFDSIYKQLNEFTVNKILDDNLNRNALELGKKYIDKSFSNVGITYTYDEIFKNIETENLTIREYAKYIFSISSYLGNELFDNIFRKRLAKQYYNPEEILNLNISDKIPETQCNSNDFSASVIKYMNDKINKDIYQFGENLFITSRDSNIELYQLSNEKTLKERFGERKHFFPSNVPEIYDSINYICKKDIGYIKVEDVILYSEKINEINNRYCLNIKDVLKHIYNNVDIDYFPEIPNWFFEDIKRKYNKKLIDEVDEEKDVIEYKSVNDEENEISEENKYEYNFVNIIISDIIEKTNNKYNLFQLYKLFGIDIVEEDDETKIGTRLLKELEKDNEGNYIFEDGGGYIEEKNDEEEDNEEDDGSYREEDEDSEAEEEEEKEADEIEEENNEEEDEKYEDYEKDKNTKKCEYCNSFKKGNEVVKTIVMNNYKKKDFEIIEVCTECLLNMEF
jgi:hypothetical protein